MAQQSIDMQKKQNYFQNVKKGNMNDLNNYINNVSISYTLFNFYIYVQKDEYYTHVFYKKSNINGHEIINGAFYAINKNKNPEPPKNIDQSYYYMNNRNPQYYINNGKNMNYNNNFLLCQNNKNLGYGNNNNDSNMDIIKNVIFILFCFFIAFIIYDFINLYNNVKKDNFIERNRCMEEYLASKCDKMKIKDGPIANDYCIEKLKCISDHTVYFHVVLIKYIRSIFSNIMKGNSFISILFFSVTIIFIIKILF